jgi:hypothetical protein
MGIAIVYGEPPPWLSPKTLTLGAAFILALLINCVDHLSLVKLGGLQ